MLRYGRHDHGGECVAATYGDSHTHADEHTRADGYAYADGNSDTDTYADSHSYGNRHTYSNGHSDGDCNTHTDGHSYGNGHTDALHGKMRTNAEAASDSSAARHAIRGGSCHCRSCTDRHDRGSHSCCS